MKVRRTFVSNSSSCSFTIPTHYFSDYHMKLLRDREAHAEKLELEWPEDAGSWQIKVGPKSIQFDTMMDNFDMEEFLKKIGLPDEAFENRWHSNENWNEGLDYEDEE